MERFVFVAAVTFAIIFAVFAVFGGPNLHFQWSDDDFEGPGQAPIMALAAGRVDAQTYEGDELRIRHVAGFVTVVPEERSDVSVEIDNPGGAPMPSISSEGGRVIVDGQLRGRIEDCKEDGVELEGYGFVANDQLPRITIHAPRALSVSISGAGRTEIGETESLDLDFSGCGAAQLGPVQGNLIIDLAGSGQITGASAQNLEADVAGSGNLSLGQIAAGADIEIAGDATVALAGLTGALDASSAGAGKLDIGGGDLGEATIELAGAGDIAIRAPIRHLDVSIFGAGDVDVPAAVGDVDAEIAGPGNVNIQSVTGAVRKEIVGGGEVRVGQ